MSTTRVCVALCSLGLALSAADAPKKSALDKAAFESWVRRVELLPENMKVNVGEPKPTLSSGFAEVPVTVDTPTGVYSLRYFVSKDGATVFKGNIYDFNKNPFQRELDKIKTDMQPSFGEAGAPVVIVVYSDFECPNCREQAQILRDNIQKNYPKEVRVYFKDYPMEGLHPWSKAAAIAGRCVFRQDPKAFWDYHDWAFAHQGELTPANFRNKAMEWASSKGIDSLQFGRCLDTKATEAEVDRSIAEGRALQINGTPTTFVNGRQFYQVTEWPTLNQVIKREIEYQKAAGDAGEKCCEVSIPSLTNK